MLHTTVTLTGIKTLIIPKISNLILNLLLQPPPPPKKTPKPAVTYYYEIVGHCYILCIALTKQTELK